MMSRTGYLQTTTVKIAFEVEVTVSVDFDGNATVEQIDAITGYRDRSHLTTLLATEPQISGQLDAAICKAFADQIADEVANAEDTSAADRADYERDMRRDDELMGVGQ